MKINEIIRTHRKKQNLTQEYIANYLNVTASAVNKWENGISYPDITLLAPLSRILDIDINTLLSFNEELTDIEINANIRELSKLIQESGYEAGFNMGCELVKQYPCEKLIFYVANTLHAYLSICNVQPSDTYEKALISWYEEVLKSNDASFSAQAASALCGFYRLKENYEKAQEYLDKIPPLGFDKQPMQAVLYIEQNNINAAYKIYENMLYKSIVDAYNSLNFIVSALCRENKQIEASRYEELAGSLAELFKFGTYMSLSPKLIIDMKNKDADSCISTLKQMIEGLDEFDSTPQCSDIFPHIKFNKIEDNIIRFMLEKSIENDSEIGFLKEHKEYKKIVEMLSKENLLQ